ncbi:hypothetical protein HUK80_01970 [Flavobacterium sp. MAH-1]|uniref:Uncharacterized protein n=1 Tax=Flavobacterium agri TaxID=2743471 RepID=A0A7Y8XZ96_9FLAO|nr:hypothetical protein [Flavobacterium agri]NUY79647.1 hypothetical protein [Flavobacterium agri]NYA69672.1 hypothetical protein [Flavobacterium agri]
MVQEKFLVRRGFTDNHLRELTINGNELKFEDGDSTNPFKIFPGPEIKDYRFGIRWIKFELTYGREYQIFVRDSDNNSIKITFKSYFGRKRNQLHKLYINILDRLWDCYFSRMVDRYREQFADGMEFSINDVLFNKDFIEISVSGIVSQSRKRIYWDNVRTSSYWTYFAIYSVENPSEINRGYSYKEDWNTNVLYSTLRTILREKGIEKYE